MVVTSNNSRDLSPFTLPTYALHLLKALQKFQKDKSENIEIFAPCSAVNTNKKNCFISMSFPEFYICSPVLVMAGIEFIFFVTGAMFWICAENTAGDTEMF